MDDYTLIAQNETHRLRHRSNFGAIRMDVWTLQAKDGDEWSRSEHEQFVTEDAAVAAARAVGLDIPGHMKEANMKQRYVVSGAWVRFNEDIHQAEAKATLSSIFADSEDGAVAEARKISEADLPGWEMVSWCARPMLSLM